MALPKTRVQLLNPDTGEVVSDVDVLSTSELISYTNDTKTVENFRGIQKGTVFDQESEKSILDRILYPYISPNIEYVYGDTTGLNNKIYDDIIIYTENHIPVQKFTLNVGIHAGSIGKLDIVFKKISNGSIDECITSTITIDPGSDYLASFDIDTFSVTSSYCVSVLDGSNSIDAPTVSFEFINPVYVGFSTYDMMNSFGEIDQSLADTYFNSLIFNRNKFIKKCIGNSSKYNAITVNDPIYSNTEMHLFILFPNEINKPAKIYDVNGMDITASYKYNSSLSIKPSHDASIAEQYTVYISENEYSVGSSIISGITYTFGGSDTTDYGISGTPIVSGFDVIVPSPLDSRTKVKKHSDLVYLSKPYEGLICYVESEHTYFKYSNNEWVTANQQIFFDFDANKTIDDYDTSIGSWNDILMNLANGEVYQKLENRRWEYKGNFHPSPVITNNVIPQMAYVNDIEKTSINIDSVLTGLPGSFAEIQNIGDDNNMKLKFTIPRGMPGVSATIEVGDVSTGQIPKVINSGTDTNAVFDFVIPEGEPGKDGKAATISIGDINIGETFKVVNVGSKNNAILDFTFPDLTKVQLDGRHCDMRINLKTIKILEVH